MARPLRIVLPDTWYHVLNRGHRRGPVFIAEEPSEAEGARYLHLNPVWVGGFGNEELQPANTCLDSTPGFCFALRPMP